MIRGDDNYADNGGSYFCWGKLEKEHIYEAKETIHRNDYSMCICSPAKGIIRFFITANDVLIMKLGADTVLKDYRSSLGKVKK